MRDLKQCTINGLRLNIKEVDKKNIQIGGIQLDYIYHNGIDKWKSDIVDPVKAKYPKPS